MHAGYSTLTDYPLGVVKLIPYKVHLVLDAASALSLAATPLLSGQWRKGPRHWVPQVALCLFELCPWPCRTQRPWVTSTAMWRRSARPTPRIHTARFTTRRPPYGREPRWRPEAVGRVRERLHWGAGGRFRRRGCLLRVARSAACLAIERKTRQVGVRFRRTRVATRLVTQAA